MADIGYLQEFCMYRNLFFMLDWYKTFKLKYQGEELIIVPCIVFSLNALLLHCFLLFLPSICSSVNDVDNNWSVREDNIIVTKEHSGHASQQITRQPVECEGSVTSHHHAGVCVASLCSCVTLVKASHAGTVASSTLRLIINKHIDRNLV